METRIFLIISYFVFTITTIAVNETNAQTEERWVPQEVLFKISAPFSSISVNADKITTEKAWFNELSDSHKIFELERIFIGDNPDLRGWYIAKFEVVEDVLHVVSSFERKTEVISALPNYIAKSFSSDPNDTHYSDQTAYLPLMNLREAWDITSGSDQIVVAIVDDGINIGHEDLVNQLWANPDEISDGVDNDNNMYVDDIHGAHTETFNTTRKNDINELFDASLTHGTRVAGIACAQTNNAKGIAGAVGGGLGGGSGVRLMTVSTQKTGSPNTAQVTSIARAFEYARLEGADIINNSFGFRSVGPPITPIRDEIAVGFTSGRNGLGIIYTAPSGNVSATWPKLGDDVFPASYFEVISVGSVDHSGQLASDSNYTGETPEVVAPGKDVWTTLPGIGGPLYGTDAGTSFASPYVAGLAALILSLNPDLDKVAVRDIITTTATPVTPPTGAGSGIVNAYAALKYTLENYGGTLSGAVTLTENFTIQSGKTLTIAAGTTVKFATGVLLSINGTLDVQGTAQSPVTFDRSGTTGTWNGIQLNNGATGTIKYVTISNATRGVYAITPLNLTVDNCTIQNFTDKGIYLNSGGNTLSANITNNTVKNSNGASHGIYIPGGSGNPVVTGNLVDGMSIGIERRDSPGAATLAGNTIKNCTTGIKTTASAPLIYDNFVENNIYGVRLATSSAPDIHDNDMFENSIGVFLEQSQPARIKWNNFGFSGTIRVNADEGLLVNFLQPGNTFLNNQWNNFYDGYATRDVTNTTATTLLAEGNYWNSFSVSGLGAVDGTPAQGSPNSDAGPGGSLGKVAHRGDDDSGGGAEIPEAFALRQNFPNPFNPTTIIVFQLPEAAEITLTIYDILGQRVRTLAAGTFYSAGSYRLTWDGRNDAGNPLASGVYVYRVDAKGVVSNARFTKSRKLVYLR